MTAALALDWATSAAMGLLILAMLFAVWRLALGPSTADRILALDLLTTLAMGFIVAFAVKTGFSLYLDVAIAIGLVGFLSTIAFARYVLHAGQRRRSEGRR